MLPGALNDRGVLRSGVLRGVALGVAVLRGPVSFSGSVAAVARAWCSRSHRQMRPHAAGLAWELDRPVVLDEPQRGEILDQFGVDGGLELEVEVSMVHCRLAATRSVGHQLSIVGSCGATLRPEARVDPSGIDGAMAWLSGVPAVSRLRSRVHP